MGSSGKRRCFPKTLKFILDTASVGSSLAQAHLVHRFELRSRHLEVRLCSHGDVCDERSAIPSSIQRALVLAREHDGDDYISLVPCKYWCEGTVQECRLHLRLGNFYC